MENKAITLEFMEQEARRYLENWLAAHYIVMLGEISLTRWDYMERPFYACVIHGVEHGSEGYFGFHIHEDGEVTFFGRMKNGERL